MIKSKIVFYVSIVVLVTSILLLASSSSILYTTIFSIPFGNIITWLGFIALQLVVFIGHKGFSQSQSVLVQFIKYLAYSFIIISLFWLFIAYGLSGNMNFNFKPSNNFQGSPDASEVFWFVNYSIIIAPIVLSILYRILLLVERRK